MKLKQYAFNCDSDLIKRINTIISKHKYKYKDRTQFIILAIEEKLNKEETGDILND